MCDETTARAQIGSVPARLRGSTAVGDYKYELRDGDAVIATGRIQLEVQPRPGDTMSLGSQPVVVEDVLRLGGTPRLILSRRSSQR
jgi:hypothetical protein